MNKLALRYTLNLFAKLVGKEHLPTILNFTNHTTNKKMSRDEYEEILGEPTFKPDSTCVNGFYLFDENHPVFKTLEKNTVALFFIGHYNPDGGCVSEFKYTFEMKNGRTVRRLHVYDQAAALLGSMPELIQYLAELGDKNISVSDFRKGLADIGLKDLTQ